MAHFSKAEAFQLGPVDAPCVLLFHGLTGAPVELWPLGRALAAVGFRVEAPLWRGHGTTPEALLDVGAKELIAQAVAIAHDVRPVAIVGLSMGALLATVAASGQPDLRALVLLAPAVRLAGPNAVFDRLGRLAGLGFGATMLKKRAALPMPPCDAPTPQGSASRDTAAQAAAGATIEIAEGARYSRLPLRWSVELQRIRAEAQRAASAVKCPVMLLHGRLDGTAHPESSLLAARWFSTACHVRFFERSPHVLTLGPERGIIAADVAEFLSRRCEIAGAAQSA